jgi:hypothetical protein
VVYLPPAIIVSPATGVTTACSRDSRLVASDSPVSSGRNPAYTPWMSSCVNGVLMSLLT